MSACRIDRVGRMDAQIDGIEVLASGIVAAKPGGSRKRAYGTYNASYDVSNIRNLRTTVHTFGTS